MSLSPGVASLRDGVAGLVAVSAVEAGAVLAGQTGPAVQE